MKHYAILSALLFATTQPMHAQQDKYQWLKEIDGTNSLDFVKKQNEASIGFLSKQKDYQSNS